jgi:polysaccharide pyruvyl transferase WcaK-like protein
MKKIGILTFHKGPNYGGFLQAWHMREAVRNLGHSADIINYQNSIHYRSEQTSFPTRLTPRGIRAWINRRKKSRPFEKVVGNLCSKPFTTDAHAISWHDYDLIIVGSDVVWDYTTPRYGHDPCYFASHTAQQNARFIAYAASCGPADNSTIPNYVKVGIPNFLAVGARDTITQTLSQSCGGVPGQLVVDPTWLQEDPAADWSGKPDHPYLLIYGGGLVNYQLDEVVSRWAKGKGLKIISAASPTKFADHRYQSLDPFQWAELFRGASAVVTATLHGLLYSIKFRKPFIMVALPAAAAKSSTVIDRLGFHDRVLKPGESLSLERVGQLLDHFDDNATARGNWIRESKDFLEKAINEHA